jgi:hypothetical protein
VYFTSCALCLLLLLTACQPPDCTSATSTLLASNSVQPSITYISDADDCGFSCWNGIQVGETNAEEALSILRTLDYVDEQSIEVETYLDGAQRILWHSSVTNYIYPVGTIYLSDESVVESFTLAPLENEVTIREVFDLIGEPEYYADSTIAPAEARFPEDACIHVELYWPADGLALAPEGVSYIEFDQGIAPILDFNSIVDGIGFLLPNEDIGEFISLNEVVEQLYPWEGFDQVQPHMNDSSSSQ